MAKKRTLSYRQVAALAESVGLPGKTFAQIAKGESGYQVGAVGHDPGGTKGLGLWQITTKYNDDIIAKYGGAKKLLTDPVANAKAAKAIYDRQGIKAWYGTKYLTSPNAHYKGPADLPQATYGSPAPTPAGGLDPRKQIALSLLGMGNLGGSYGGTDLTTQLLQAAQQKAAPQTKAPKQAAAYGPAPSGGSVAHFDGKPVVSWMVPILQQARQTGLWKGSVTSGVRTKEQQLSAAKNYGLQHYPHGPLASNHVAGHPGAVDVSDPQGLKRALKKLGVSKLKSSMPEDPVHFSATGY